LKKIILPASSGRINEGLEEYHISMAVMPADCCCSRATKHDSVSQQLCISIINMMPPVHGKLRAALDMKML